ncbi:MAG: hydrogenase maturation nickel metallochaperone HypA [Nitrospira sp.]|nr:hydrogenase maturation nickel metallochaperone HypA [Nitrospira sp.]
MHEFHLMTQVVKAVEEKLSRAGAARLSAVRLKVSALSHLLTHDHSALQITFELAARDTKAEGAALEIIPVPGGAWCPRCNRDTMVTESDDVCPVCGNEVIARPTEPEVMLHELVVQE